MFSIATKSRPIRKREHSADILEVPERLWEQAATEVRSRAPFTRCIRDRRQIYGLIGRDRQEAGRVDVGRSRRTWPLNADIFHDEIEARFHLGRIEPAKAVLLRGGRNGQIFDDADFGHAGLPD